MKIITSITKTLSLVFLFFNSTNAFSQDPNFHIYICFGQSNMEGQGTIQTQDLTVNSRFKVMSAKDCSNLSRTKYTWYTAVPPLTRCYTKLSPADYFGKTMVANLPDSISIGVINVSVGGCNIGLFDKVNYTSHLNTYTDAWFQNILTEYDSNPYAFLIDLALQAQNDGVIKGVLLHQGETNTGDAQWPTKVQTIYNYMLSDLSLSADEVPLLAGQVVGAAQGGCCSSMNNIINTLPNTIPTAHVISSEGCTVQDNAHFNSEGYRKLGRRYAVQILSLMGYKAQYDEAECGTIGSEWLAQLDATASNGSFIRAVTGVQNLTIAPSDNATVEMNFTVDKDSTYYIYGRFQNPTTANDAYWIKVDNGTYELVDNLTTTGWQWLPIKSYDLTAGTHTVRIGVGENGGYLDKIVVKNSQITPVDIAEEADNICVPTITSIVNSTHSTNGYALEQNHPHPSKGNTSISFELPKSCHVSIKIYDAQGNEITELAGVEYGSGKHSLTFNHNHLPMGTYFYTIRTDEFTATKKMILN